MSEHLRPRREEGGTLVASPSAPADGFWTASPLTPSSRTPNEGWLTVAFLLAMDLAVIISVQATQWVNPMPRLWAVALMGFLVSLVVLRYRGPIVVQIFLHLLVIVLGLGIVVVEAAGTLSGPPADKLAEAVQRVSGWAMTLSGDGISNDRLPFHIIIGFGAWLIVYLSALFTFRLRWPWAAVIPPAVGLMTHQTYLPPSSYPLPLFFFLLFAILFMGQTNLVRHSATQPASNTSRRRKALYSLLALTAMVLALSWAAPLWEVTWSPLHSGYLATRGPYASMETELERMFAGVPAQKAGSLHTFGSALPLRGASGTGETVVFSVVADYPAYWRGQSYDFYQGQGWLARSDHRALGPLSKSPLTKRAAPAYKKQVTTGQQFTLAQDSRIIFTGGQPTKLSLDSTVELSTPRAYVISLTAPPQPGSLPPDLFTVAQKAAGTRQTARQVKASLPAGTQVVREGVDTLTVVRDRPLVADVLSVRGTDRLKMGSTYQVYSLTSIASAEDLRADGTAYPSWVLDTYLQLPPNLPQRVRDLAKDVSSNAPNPYAKAEAIQTYLRDFSQVQDIEPPPLNADAVDYFLFTTKSGYGDYFAASMTILLRAAGVPARFAAGYSSGMFDERNSTFTVRQSDAHSWPEVFFPSYGWIAFEPMPSLGTLPRGSLRQPSEVSPEELSDDQLATPIDDLLEDFHPFDGFLAPQDTSLVNHMWRLVRRFAGVGAAVILGVSLAMAGLATLFWQANFWGMPYAISMYARMSVLGTLAWRGPKGTETPTEYAAALSGALALRRDHVDAISGGYTRSRYSGHVVERDDRIAIERAWRGVRRSMLRRVAQRLDLRDALKRET